MCAIAHSIADDRARIVHVINRLRPGGAELQLIELVRRSHLPHSVIQLDYPAARSAVPTLRHLGRALRGTPPGVVVAWLDRSQIATAIVASGTGHCLVGNIRGLPQRRRALDAWELRAALSRFDALVTNSEASRTATRSFARPWETAPFVVIPNGVELPPVRASAPRGPRLRVAWIGRANEAKGLDVMLGALDELECEPIDATLVGRGVPEAVAAHSGPARRHRVWPANDDPWQLVGSTDLLVLSSRSEGSPNVVIEAFARCVPVVGTCVGGAAELLADGRGLVVQPDDARALAAAVRSVAADPDAARDRAGRALRYVSDHHAWPSVISAYDDLLGPLLEGADARRRTGRPLGVRRRRDRARSRLRR